jgi:hypothetical protein
MKPRNIDAPTTDTLAYVCSREYEDHLDWLENQGRPSYDIYKPFRLFAGLAAGVGTVAWAASLMF